MAPVLRPSTRLRIPRCPSRVVLPISTHLQLKRAYAQVGSATYVGGPPPPPPPPTQIPTQHSDPLTSDTLDNLILNSLTHSPVSLPTLFAQSVDRSGYVLDVSLPYEPLPSAERRVSFGVEEAGSCEGVAMVAHAVRRGGRGEEWRVTRCSGFALEAGVFGSEGTRGEGAQVMVTCMHTLQEVSIRIVKGIPC